MARVEAADHRTLAAKLGRTARIDFLLIDKALQFGHEFVRLEGGGKEFQHTLQVFDLYRFPGLDPGVKAVLISLIFPRREQITESMYKTQKLSVFLSCG